MSELICDREFTHQFDGVRQRLVVEWMKPVREKGDWRCQWVVHWFSQEADFGSSVGIDSVESLILAMKSVHDLLRHKGTDVRWHDGVDLGLPRFDADGAI